jgi:hypothetical protein
MTRPHLTPKEKIVLLGVAIALALLAVDPVSEWLGERRGRAEAAADIERGVLKLKMAGKRQWWNNEYRRLLNARYGVDQENFAGCCPTGYQRGYMQSYNELMLAEITARRGTVPFDALQVEARDRAQPPGL